MTNWEIQNAKKRLELETRYSEMVVLERQLEEAMIRCQWQIEGVTSYPYEHAKMIEVMDRMEKRYNSIMPMNYIFVARTLCCEFDLMVVFSLDLIPATGSGVLEFKEW